MKKKNEKGRGYRHGWVGEMVIDSWVQLMKENKIQNIFVGWEQGCRLPGWGR